MVESCCLTFRSWNGVNYYYLNRNLSNRRTQLGGEGAEESGDCFLLLLLLFGLMQHLIIVGEGG